MTSNSEIMLPNWLKEIVLKLQKHSSIFSGDARMLNFIKKKFTFANVTNKIILTINFFPALNNNIIVLECISNNTISYEMIILISSGGAKYLVI